MVRERGTLRNSLAAGLLVAFAAPASAEDAVAVSTAAPKIDAAVANRVMQVGRIVDGQIVAAPGEATPLPPVTQPQPQSQSPAETPAEPKKTFAQMRLEAPTLKVGEVCTIIREAAEAHRLPKPFLARLIWKESRFDTKAVSPVGALGIAQFMPGTAKLEKLDNPFDPRAAIWASAKHLADMRLEFGNLGLAAIGYNAGRERARKFLGGNDWLPAETENYVASILGRAAEDYAEGQVYGVQPLKKGLSFREACRKLPVIRTRAVALSGDALPSAKSMPWHVQVSQHFARHVAVNMYKKVRRRHASIIGKLPYAVVQERGRGGMIPQKSVRVGAGSRGEAQAICSRLKRAGGSCIVKRNRRG